MDRASTDKYYEKPVDAQFKPFTNGLVLQTRR